MRSPDVDPARIILYGHSLGGAVALHLAAANPHSFMAVIIENTFLSIPKMASYAQPKIAWATFMVTDIWDNEAQIRKLKEAARDKTKRAAHILFITGEHDHVVPPAQMTELWRQIQELSPVRPDIKIARMHMDLCKHTCFGVAGYHDHLSRFYYSISGERTMQALALPKNAPEGML